MKCIGFAGIAAVCLMGFMFSPITALADDAEEVAPVISGYETVEEPGEEPGEEEEIWFDDAWFDTSGVSGENMNIYEKFQYVQHILAALEIEPDSSTVLGNLLASDPTKNVKIEVTVVKKVGDTWEVVNSWKADGIGRASMNEKITTSKDFTYKIIVEGQVLDDQNNVLEQVIRESESEDKSEH